jgi:hypothetical protein
MDKSSVCGRQRGCRGPPIGMRLSIVWWIEQVPTFIDMPFGEPIQL